MSDNAPELTENVHAGPSMVNAPKTADRKAKKKTAAQLEAEGIETVTVEYGGHEFIFPSDPQDWSAGALRAFEAGHAVDACRLLVGPNLWNRRKMDDWTGRQVDTMFKRFADAAGLGDSGE